MPSRNVTLITRAVGARQAARDMTLVSRATASVGSNARRANTNMGRLGQTMGMLKRSAATVSLGLGVLGASAIRTGIQYNAMMQQQTIAFQNMLGGTGPAQAFLKRLYDLAKVTPFEFPQLVKGTRTMVAYGMASEAAFKQMQLLGDAIAANPSEDMANQIQRSARALGQVQAAGVLHAQDLNQLVDAQIVSVPKLAKNMGLSTKQFRKEMALGKLDADRFFKALNKLWSEDPIYKGAAAKQAKTWIGQMATLHDTYVQATGSITNTIFTAMEKNVLPTAIKLMEDINTIWAEDSPFTSLEDKLAVTKSAVADRLEPLIDGIEEWWESERIGARLSMALESALKNAAEGAANAVPVILEKFWGAFKGMGPGGQALTAGILLTKLGITGRIMDQVGNLFGSLFGKAVGKTKIGGKLGMGTMNVTAGVVNVIGGGGPGGVLPTKNPGKLSRFFKWAGRNKAMLGRMGLGAAAAYAMWELAEATHENDLPTRGPEPARRREEGRPRRGRTRSGRDPFARVPGDTANPWTYTGGSDASQGGYARGGRVRRGGFYDVGERGKERVYLPKDSTVDPKPDRDININLVVDGKVLASTVHREGTRARASR